MASEDFICGRTNNKDMINLIKGWYGELLNWRKSKHCHSPSVDPYRKPLERWQSFPKASRPNLFVYLVRLTLDHRHLLVQDQLVWVFLFGWTFIIKMKSLGLVVWSLCWRELSLGFFATIIAASSGVINCPTDWLPGDFGSCAGW